MLRAVIMALTALMLGLALGAGGSTAMPASAVRAATAAGRSQAASAALRTQLLSGIEYIRWQPRNDKTANGLSEIDTTTQLMIAFLADPAPLSNPALMNEIVTTDTDAVERCMGQLKPEDAAHWDALMAAAVYTRQQYEKDGASAGYQVSFPVRSLFRLLRAQARPAFTPQVVRWLHDPSLAPLRNDQAALLARCGGPGASTELDAYYASLQVKHHAVPEPQALIRRPQAVEDDYLLQRDGLYREAGLWAEARGADGTRYALFPAEGLISDRDLYLAVDALADGVWDEVLPTGLQDMCFTHSHPGGPHVLGPGIPGPQGKLQITVADGAVKIMHHQPVIGNAIHGAGNNQWTETEPTGLNRVTTKLKLDDLHIDTDGDELTDVLEQRLFLDPAKADTDGDGITDAQDSAPLADPARMGAVERGIARALAYMMAINKYDYTWWNTSLEQDGYASTAGQPWSARYLLVHGCGPVDFCPQAPTYSICLNTPAQRDAYRAALQFYPPMSAVEISWTKRHMDPFQAWQASGLSDSQPVPKLREAKKWQRYFHRPLRKEPAAALIVYIDYWLHGAVVFLVELEGEYYPYDAPESWNA